MDSLYQEIAQVFNDNKSVFTDAGLPAVRQVDIYMGQPDSPEDFEIFLPAVFVDWSITPGGVGEEDLLQLDFHVVQDPGARSENFSDRLTESMEYILLLKKVKYLVNRLRSDTSTPLTYNGERPRVTPYFKYHIASYKCLIDTDEGSIIRSTSTDAEPENVNISKGTIRKYNTPTTASDLIDTFKA